MPEHGAGAAESVTKDYFAQTSNCVYGGAHGYCLLAALCCPDQIAGH